MNSFQKIINRYISGKNKYKLLSVLLAILLWFFVDKISYQETIITIPINIINIPPQYTLTEKEDLRAEIKIKEKIDFLQSYEYLQELKKLFRAEIDLKNATVGVNYYPVRLNVSKNKIINYKLITEKVKLKVDYYVQKNVPVKAVVSGKPKDGYFVSKIILNPPDITISGPATTVGLLSEIETYPINIDNADKNISQSIMLKIPSNVITLYGYRITATIVIEKQ